MSWKHSLDGMHVQLVDVYEYLVWRNLRNLDVFEHKRLVVFAHSRGQHFYFSSILAEC
jgi:hypothetical protein